MASFLSVFLVFIFYFFSLSHGREHRLVSSNFIDVHVDSLFPQEELTCTHSSRGKHEHGVSMEVAHRHGACSKIKSAHTTPPSHFDLLQVDQERVDSFHTRISGKPLAGYKVAVESKSINLPAKSGASIGTANYIVSVGLGTPRKALSLVFDTGSGLTWTQCKPCVKYCYSQVDPIFKPSSSSSYTNISCTSPVCRDLVLGSGKHCSSSTPTCIYGIQYGDGSFSVGYLAKERLSLSSTDYIDDYLFGCGEDNQGLFNGAAGLIGLDQNKISLVSQAANKYGKYFSYCLPASSSSTGHLTLGHGGYRATSFSYTPLVKGLGIDANLYFISLESISVGGRRLAISPAVFSNTKTIIDSGTVITRLPPKAFSLLNSTFSHFMSKYPSAPALEHLGSCYDFSKYETVMLPEVVLYFRGGGILNLGAENIIYIVSISQVCLAFTGNNDDSQLSILGNVQQQGFDVVYDVDGTRIGFGAGGC